MPVTCQVTYFKRDYTMNARQALIVRTFMNTQNFWSWPADKAKIIDEVKSIYSYLNKDDLEKAFHTLFEEGFFSRICYPAPVFKKKYFICS